MQNRRQFTRILFSINAVLEIDGQDYQVNIHDISLNGALVSRPETQTCFLRSLGTLKIALSDTNTQVSMFIAVVHEENDEIGLQCNAIDIDSVSHLRRLVELNLGDTEQLNKELSQLSKEHI
jgi:hypothetical protein